MASMARKKCDSAYVQERPAVNFIVQDAGLTGQLKAGRSAARSFSGESATDTRGKAA